MAFSETTWLIGFIMIIITFSVTLIYIIIIRKFKSQVMNNKELLQYPDLTILLPVRNESIVIKQKLKEINEMNYPGIVKLIIIDSLSDDGTLLLVNDFFKHNKSKMTLKILKVEKLGKSFAINGALDLIDTDFFVMMDADAILEQNSLIKIINNFSNENIGAVSSRLEINADDSDFPYRKNYNKLRVAESLFDSTPIFEGSFCAFRTSAVGKYRLNPKINADDTQLSIIVRKNNFKSIMDSDIVFYEPPSSDFNDRKRKTRRAQGLIRVLISNWGLIFKRDKYSFVFLHTFYFHIVMPWLLLFSLSILSFSSISNILNSQSLQLDIHILTMGVIFLSFSSRTVRIFATGVLILLMSQILIITGISLHIWDRDENLRIKSNKMREDSNR